MASEKEPGEKQEEAKETEKETEAEETKETEAEETKEGKVSCTEQVTGEGDIFSTCINTDLRCS